jgi:CRP-like cAMP-binding protein
MPFAWTHREDAMSSVNQSFSQPSPPGAQVSYDSHSQKPAHQTDSGHIHEAPSNKLLAALPAAEYEHLRPHLRPFRMELGEIIRHPGQHLTHAYFVENGMISIVLTAAEGTEVEVGAVGCEGVVGASAVLTNAPILSTIMVQIHGKALTLPADVLRQEFKRGGVFQDVMLTNMQSLAVLSSQAALCNRLHSVEKRLARWLLMVHDRVGDRHLELTHEFLAGMLGTRRAGVTEAAGALRAAGLIDYDRGHIQIIDRKGLEAITCECYTVAREQFQHAVS